MTFGEKLKSLREKADMTQIELAEASGLGLGTIRDYEQGKKEPILRNAVKLADALGVNIHKLVVRESPPAQRPRGRKGK